jgi:hypothetical protein
MLALIEHTHRYSILIAFVFSVASAWSASVCYYLIISRELAPPNGNAIENILLVMDKTRNNKGGDNEHQPRKLNTKK